MYLVYWRDNLTQGIKYNFGGGGGQLPELQSKNLSGPFPRQNNNLSDEDDFLKIT